MPGRKTINPPSLALPSPSPVLPAEEERLSPAVPPSAVALPRPPAIPSLTRAPMPLVGVAKAIGGGVARRGGLETSMRLDA